MVLALLEVSEEGTTRRPPLGSPPLDFMGEDLVGHRSPRSTSRAAVEEEQPALTMEPLPEGPEEQDRKGPGVMEGLEREGPVVAAASATAYLDTKEETEETDR